MLLEARLPQTRNTKPTTPCEPGNTDLSDGTQRTGVILGKLSGFEDQGPFVDFQVHSKAIQVVETDQAQLGRPR